MKMKSDSENNFRDRLMRLPEVATTFGMSQRTVRRQSEGGNLPALKRVGRVVGMLQSDVEAYFQRLREQQAK